MKQITITLKTSAQKDALMELLDRGLAYSDLFYSRYSKMTRIYNDIARQINSVEKLKNTNG